MGDVMGKGIPAGLLMTLLRGMLRAEVLTGLPPDRILHDLNELAQELSLIHISSPRDATLSRMPSSA